MKDLSLYFGPNAGYVLELYERYQQDPESVDAETRALFEHWNPTAQQPANNGSAPPGLPTTDRLTSRDISHNTAEAMTRIVAAARATRLLREHGHMAARIDPLGGPPPSDPCLELSTHGLAPRDLAFLPPTVVGGPLAEGAANALEALERLRAAYAGSVGYETDHIQIAEERDWLYYAIESGRFFQGFDAERKHDLLERLTVVETFERYLHRVFPGGKRFSIEGTDTLVPMLDEIIHKAALFGTRETVLGMAHRGRLNVMAHVLGKPYEDILAEFLDNQSEEEAAVSGRASYGWSGDVKYHLGASRAYQESGVQEMPLTLLPNPSHLEFVNPVVEGNTRAAQEDRSHPGPPVQDVQACLPILIHGDAAFPGQGIVAETLNLANLPGYRTGGTIHIIVNNQIGFTTKWSDARSTLYAGDLAKGFEIPIVHVNADDMEACIAMARMALAYRGRFQKDFLIDLIGYRRHGHNEGDEPAFTQPKMYAQIATHPTVREIWAKKLEKEGVVTSEEAAAMVKAVEERLNKARDIAAQNDEAEEDGEPIGRGRRRPIETAVPADQLLALHEALLARPEGFTPNARLESKANIFGRRRARFQEEGGIDWAHAEALAFASILADGAPIRLTGQDTERGTFSQRHLVLHDMETGESYCPHQHLPQAKAAFAVYNSPLSENAAIGFEYGYSIHAPDALVLWEAQFGDFSNSAQVMIDQFIVSGNAKWRQIPSLALLLPHGYEGQGPEHSSARLERFLQLAANNNLRIVNCTTAAQYFHVLRRQAALLQVSPRPLIVMTPKNLLRHPMANSSLSDLARGAFQPVIDDASAQTRAAQVTRLALCSGRVYVDLMASKGFAAERVAVARVEELYPFPVEEIRALFQNYPNLRDIVWLQEEPSNMGAWQYMEPRLRKLAGWKGDLLYAGRLEAASPAEGSGWRHKAVQAQILARALEGVPELTRAAKERDLTAVP